MSEIGRKLAVGIAKETTPGTPVAPAFWIQVDDRELAPRENHAENEAARGSIQAQGQSEIVEKFGEPSFGGPIFDKSFGLLLLTALGTVSTSSNDPESGVHTHTYSVLDTNAHPALSIGMKDAVLDKVASYAVLNSLGIEVNSGEFSKYTASFMSRFPATASQTAAFVEENKFVPKFVSVKLAANVAGLGAAGELDLDGFSLTIEKAVEKHTPFSNAGSNEPKTINNGALRITGELRLRFKASTLYDLFAAGTNKALRITFANTGVTIGSSTNPTFTITLGSVSFREWNPDTANDSFISETIPFTAETPTSDAFAAATAINTQASY